MSPSRTDLPEHVTLPLLSVVTKGALDEDYQHVAEQRAAAGEPPGKGRDHRYVALVALLFGAMLVIATVQTSRNAATTEEGRQELIRQISIQREDLRASQGRIRDLREQNAELEAGLDEVAAAEDAASEELLQLRGATGFAPVTGPGVRVRVDDAPDGSDNGVVRDEDLAVLIDGLWVAGAEAISVNGQRLSNVSAIRAVGRGIRVRRTTLKPPYEVLAIGNPNTLQSLFTESRSGLEWQSLRNAYGFEFSMENANNLSLPGSRRPQLRSAVPAEGKAEALKEATP